MASQEDILRGTAPATTFEPDAHGQAALLLTESLLHMLVERSVLTNTEAVEVVQTSAEVKVEVATAAGESSKRMNESLTLLIKMRRSFESDQLKEHT
jgi:hypothetical protein